MIGNLKISTPRFTMKPKRTFVGLDRAMTIEDIPTIPAQWAAFNEAGYEIENAVGKGTYGIVHGFKPDNSWRYACAYEVRKLSIMPNGCVEIAVPAATFGVFKSTENISQIGEVISAVSDWVETSEYQSASDPTLEYYGPSYDPETGDGGFEIWTPVAPAD